MTHKMLNSLKRILLTAVAVAVTLTAWAKMTDQQVIDYIKRQTAMGKTEQQIGKELLAKGVTKEQIERLRDEYAGKEETVAASKKTTKKTGAGEKLEGLR